MLPLGFRFDVDVVILDGAAHGTPCPLRPAALPVGAKRLAAAETLGGTLSP
jgi:hypothetical protein